MLRRSFLGAAAAALTPSLACPALSQTRMRTLVFVPAAPLTALDPIWTTAAVTRVHGYLVFDSLYGLDSDFNPRPQMASGATVRDDGLTWSVRLRSGLSFHDGEAVRGRDCVASLKRWMKRSPMGQKLDTVLNELAAPDDTTLRFSLKRPFPQLLEALAAVGPQALIMPERLAATSPFEQVKDVVGSGPYRFEADEFISGSRAVYRRFDGYRPTSDHGSGLTAGPKIANFDQVIWNMIPDPATAAAALMSGEVDWYEQVAPDLTSLLGKNRNIVVEKQDRFPQVAGLRFNQLTTPFDSKKLRQALLPAISQEDVAIAIAGNNPGFWMRDVGVFTPGTPSASSAGLEPLRGPRDYARAKRMMKEAGYEGQKLRQLSPTDLPSVTAASQVVADVLQRLGFNLELAVSDWGTVVQRRASKEPLDKGGWSVFCTSYSWFEFADPAVNVALRGNGRDAYFGWPTVPRLEELRDRWFETPEASARKSVAEEMQLVGLDELPILPLGGAFNTTAYNRNLTDRIIALPLFWGIRRA